MTALRVNELTFYRKTHELLVAASRVRYFDYRKQIGSDIAQLLVEYFAYRLRSKRQSTLRSQPQAKRNETRLKSTLGSFNGYYNLLIDLLVH
jgi:hypothetical protein